MCRASNDSGYPAARALTSMRQQQLRFPNREHLVADGGLEPVLTNLAAAAAGRIRHAARPARLVPRGLAGGSGEAAAARTGRRQRPWAR